MRLNTRHFPISRWPAWSNLFRGRPNLCISNFLIIHRPHTTRNSSFDKNNTNITISFTENLSCHDLAKHALLERTAAGNCVSRAKAKRRHSQQNGDANERSSRETTLLRALVVPKLIHGVALRSQRGRSTRAMGKHPMPNRNRLLHYLGGETETSAWPVIRDQAGLSCVAEAAVLDDSRLIV